MPGNKADAVPCECLQLFPFPFILQKGELILLFSYGLMEKDHLALKRPQNPQVDDGCNMIDSHAFGTMVIDGKTYTSDLIIFPDSRVKDRWWRKKGHLLTLDDIKTLINEKAEIIIAGTGTSGGMKPEKGIEIHLLEKGITLIAAPNAAAVEAFNEKKKAGIVIGACFHLTC